MSSVFLALTGLSALVVLLLCWKADEVGRRFGLMDQPSGRKLHRAPTPLLGGIALLIGCVPPMLAWILHDASVVWTGNLLIIVAATIAMALVGLADDRRELKPRDRMLISFLVFGSAALFSPLFNVRTLSFAENPAFEIGLAWGGVAVAFTAFCCVGLVNAVNMADGKNGLVIGLCIGWLMLIGVRAPAPLLMLILMLIACLVVLFAFNMFGKLFLGDGGSHGFATVVGLIAIAVYNSSYPVRRLWADELILLFGIPIFDLFRLMVTRTMQGRSPMSADRNHLHHHLMNWFGWPGGLLVYYIVALGPAAVLILARS